MSDDCFKKIRIFGFISLIGGLLGVALLIGGGAIAGVFILGLIGIILIPFSFFFGMIGGVIVFFVHVKKLAAQKEKSIDENASKDPIEPATELTYRQHGFAARYEYGAHVFADSINGYKILPKKEKVGAILVLTTFFSGIAALITGAILSDAGIQPLGNIMMFSGFGFGAGVVIIAGIAKNLPERIKAKKLKTKPASVKVYEKEAVVLQSLKHSAKERITANGRNSAVFDIVYNVYLDCDGKVLSSRSFNCYKKGAKIKVYIDVAKPKNVYISLENLIIPIIVPSGKH